MSELSILYVCVAAVIIVFIIAVACVLVNSVSYFDLRDYHKMYEMMRGEVGRVQIQTNVMYDKYLYILQKVDELEEKMR